MIYKPMVYYAFFIILGNVFFLLNKISFFISIICCFILFVLFFYTLYNKNFFIICMLFFIMAFFSFNLYFNIEINEKEIVRINNKSYKCEANIKGRKIILKGNTKFLEEGKKYKIKGSFVQQCNYKRGIIGYYNVLNYKEEKQDIIYKFYKIKNEMYKKYMRILNKEDSSIIMALCFGEDKYLNNNLKKDFSKLGISHILCVSGFHISIVYKLFESLFGMNIALFLCFMFVIITGGKSSSIRAFIMIFLMKISNKVYKNYDSISALSLSAIIILLFKPYYILDIGFNLSFLATLSIILFYKKINRVLYKLPQNVNESLSITLSAQILTIPYLSFTIKEVSLFFIAGNIILVPLYSLCIILGILSFMFFKINYIFKIICYMVKGILAICKYIAYGMLYIFPGNMKVNLLYGIFILFLYSYYFMLKYFLKNRELNSLRER